MPSTVIFKPGTQPRRWVAACSGFRFARSLALGEGAKVQRTVKLVRSDAPLRRVLRRSLLLHFYRVNSGVHQTVEMELLGFGPMILDVTTDMLRAQLH
jgi:hypothetical protein